MKKMVTCDVCGLVFESDWSKEESLAEKEKNGFGNVPDDECFVVCDDCYNKKMAELTN